MTFSKLKSKNMHVREHRPNYVLVTDLQIVLNEGLHNLNN